MRYSARWFGDLPHEMINRTLELELAPGRVYLSARAHRHIAIDHAPDYRIVMDAIEATILSPTFVGQAPRHAANFEMIKRLAVIEEDEAGRTLKRYFVLVAIRLEPDENGCYRIVRAIRSIRRMSTTAAWRGGCGRQKERLPQEPPRPLAGRHPGSLGRHKAVSYLGPPRCVRWPFSPQRVPAACICIGYGQVNTKFVVSYR